MRAPVLAYISRPSSGGRIGFCPCTIFTGRLARTTRGIVLIYVDTIFIRTDR